MTQNENQKIDIDIFDIRPSEAQGLSPADKEQKVDNQPFKKKKHIDFLLNLGPVHFGALAFILACIWIFFPSIFSSNEGFHAESYKNEEFVNVPVADLNPALSENEKVIDLPKNGLSNDSPIAKESLPDAITKVESIHTAESQEKIDSLQQQITQIQAKLNQCATLTSYKKKTAFHKKKSTKKVFRQTNHDVSAKEVVHTDLKINTIHRGQAWIKNKKEDSIHLVEEGDAIGDVRVLNIEPESRRVVTTFGEIR